MNENILRLAVTGLDWLGGGIGSIESAMEEMFKEAKEQIDITAYSITDGADLLFKWIMIALNSGIRVRIIVNKRQSQFPATVSKLESIARKYKHFILYYFNADDTDLHAKMVVADRSVAIIGSSNLSRNGFLFNHEIAVYIKGFVAEEAANTLDRLFKSKRVIQYKP